MFVFDFLFLGSKQPRWFQQGYKSEQLEKHINQTGFWPQSYCCRVGQAVLQEVSEPFPKFTELMPKISK